MTAARAYLRGLVTSAFETIEDPDEAVATAVDLFAVVLVEAKPEKRRAIGAVLVDRAIARIGAADAR